MPIVLSKISETSTTITLGWTPPAGVDGYVFYANGQVASVATANLKDGSPRNEVKFSKTSPGPPFAVVAVLSATGAVEVGSYGGATPPPPPPPPPPMGYPASYFTGPLGNANPVPPRKGAFLGGELSLLGGSITWEQQKAQLQKREADTGRKYDIVMLGNPQAVWADNRLQWMHDHGVIPVCAYMDVQTNVTDIANGGRDSMIDAYADHMKQVTGTVMLRLFHEFDGAYVWSAVGREADFVRAWKRVVDRFKARGATNVGFWWCPNEGTNRATINACYPGDAYVDWVGTDSYNHQPVGGGGYATPMHPGWAKFWEMFDYPPGPGYQSQHSKWGPLKPFIISETGCLQDAANPTKKGEWFAEIPAAARNMEYLCGVLPFDVDWNGRGDTMVDHPVSVPQVYAGFKSLAADPWFNTRT